MWLPVTTTKGKQKGEKQNDCVMIAATITGLSWMSQHITKMKFGKMGPACTHFTVGKPLFKPVPP